MAEQISETKIIAEEISKNRAEHEQKIKELFTKTEICGIEEFYNNYQQEVKDINSEITPSKDSLTILNFKEIFQTFEKYPSNLQKAKKVVPKDANRNLSMSRASSTNEISVMCQSNTSSVSPPSTIYEQGPTAAEIYSGFREFRKSLNKLEQELKQTELEKEYIKKLQKLNTFAKDIEKLCGTESRNVQHAFTDEETSNLKQLVENLEKAIFINNNRNLFKDGNLDHQSHQQNLESVLELLTFWLNSVGHYKEM